MTTANVTLPLDLPSVHSCGQHNSDEEKVDEDVLKGCITDKPILEDTKRACRVTKA